MTIQMSYTQSRAQFATLMDQVTNNREVVIIQRQGMDDVALIAADELSSLLETTHLLRSPANAERLRIALARVRKRSGYLTEGAERWQVHKENETSWS